MLSSLIIIALAFAIAGNILCMMGYDNKHNPILYFGVFCFIMSLALTGTASYLGHFDNFNTLEIHNDETYMHKTIP